MSIPESTIAKYNKVRELSIRGEGNEATTAQRILAKMERQHAGIKEAADEIRLEHQLFEEDELDHEPERHWSEVYQEQQQQQREKELRKQKWSGWKDKAESFFRWAAENAHQAFTLRELQDWAYDVEIRLRENKSGSISAAVKIPKDIVWKVDTLSDQQRLIFSRLVGQMVEQEIFEYLGEDNL